MAQIGSTDKSIGHIPLQPVNSDVIRYFFERESMSTPIILVHGAFHGAWCWDKVVRLINKSNINVIAIDLPGHGDNTNPLADLYGDAAAIRELLHQIEVPPILLGHSFAGGAITEAVDDSALIKHIVYLAAVLTEEGKSMAEDTPYFGDDWPYYHAVIDNGDGTLSLDTDKTKDVFYHDCSIEDAEWATSKLCNQRIEANQVMNYSPWSTVESTYVICAKDRVLPVNIQWQWAAKCDHQVMFDTGHSPMLSQPELLANLLIKLSTT